MNFTKHLFTNYTGKYEHLKTYRRLTFIFYIYIYKKIQNYLKYNKIDSHSLHFKTMIKLYSLKRLFLFWQELFVTLRRQQFEPENTFWLIV